MRIGERTIVIRDISLVISNFMTIFTIDWPLSTP